MVLYSVCVGGRETGQKSHYLSPARKEKSEWVCSSMQPLLFFSRKEKKVGSIELKIIRAQVHYFSENNEEEPRDCDCY